MTWLEKAQARRAELEAKFARLNWLEEFISTSDWGALESGAEIRAGRIVRFGALRYRARIDHSKAMVRSPINLVYWEVL